MTQETLAEAVDRLGLSIKAEFVPWSKSRNKGEDHRTLNWSVTLLCDGRAVLHTDYSAGIAHCPAYKSQNPIFGKPNSAIRKRAIDLETETGRTARYSSLTGDVGTFVGMPIMPDPLDVIASRALDASVLDYRNFEDWAGWDFGYDTDSRKALAIYDDCVSIALNLRHALGDDGLSALRWAAAEY